MNNFIFTERKNFKIFLKENYAIALNSCCISTKKMLNMELNIMLIVLMEFAYIIDIPTLYSTFNEYLAILADDEFDSLLVCHIVRLFFIYLWGHKVTNFLQALMAPVYWEALE